MELIELTKDLKDLRSKGFLDCNIEAILLKLRRIENESKVEVPQFVADWFEKYENNLELKIWKWMRYNSREEAGNHKFFLWLQNANNKPVETLVKMKLFGYTIKEDKKYTVRVKGIDGYSTHLNKNLDNGAWFFASDTEIKGFRVEHTKYELEEGGFGEVFNSPLFEVKEVTNEKG